MPVRAYVLANAKTGTERSGLAQAVTEILSLEAVTFAETVLGAYDLFVAVETEQSFEEVVERLRAVPAVDRLEVLKVESIPARDRMWKNLAAMPLEPR